MRERCIRSALSLLLVCLVLISCVIHINADEDPAAQLAEACFEAIRKGRNKVEMEIRSSDAESVLHEALQDYPVLYHYYDSASWIQYTSKFEIAVKLKNIEDSVESIWIVRNQEELMAVVGIGMLELQNEICFVTVDDFGAVMDMSDAINVLREQYYLVYMGYNGFSSTTTGYDDVMDVALEVQYYENISPGEFLQWRKETEAKWLELSKTLFAVDMPDAEILLRIHDWIVDNTRYNDANMDDPANYMAYGCLSRGKCVCQGYAETFRLLCQSAGIDVCYVSGTGITRTSQESHGWNAVLLDGEWYMVDTTWDDSVSNLGVDTKKYDYFLVTGDQLAEDHVWDVNAYPACTGKTWTAERVLQEYGQTDQRYIGYGSADVMTMDRARVEFFGILSDGQSQIMVPQESESSMSPDPRPNEIPVVSTEPGQNSNPQPQPQPDNSSPLLWSLLLVVLPVAAAAAVIFLRSKSGRRRRTLIPYTQDWGSPQPSMRTKKRGDKKGDSSHLPGSEW